MPTYLARVIWGMGYYRDFRYGRGVKEQRDPLEDRMVTPERSVFGTRLPRPPGVGRHLIVVVVLLLAALAVAIFFAEQDTVSPETVEQKS